MTGRRFSAALSVLWVLGAGLSLAGCSYPIGLYHSAEGGAIAQNRQAPPGANQPYPNLADVPAAPSATAPDAAATISAQAHNGGTGVSPASPGALAGLELPTAAPPPPLAEPAAPRSPPPAPALAPAPAPVRRADGAPLALAFPPGSAILPFADLPALQHLTTQRGGAHIRVGGFGEGALPLAIARARRLADTLTAAGVPPDMIHLTANAAGSGGFAQLVY